MSDRESGLERPEETGSTPEEPTAGASGSEQPGVAPALRPEPTKVESRRVFVGTGVFWGLVLAVLLAVAVIILAAQNTQTVTVEFLAFEFDTSLIVVLLAALLIGVVLDEIVGWVYRARRRRILTEREELKHLRADH